MAISLTGTNYIDALLAGYSWTGNAGQSTIVKYSFQALDDPANAVPAAMQSGYTAAMAEWSKVANITFQSSSFATSMLDLYRADLSAAGSTVLGLTYSYPSGSTQTYAQLAIDDRFNSAASVAKGTLGFMTLMHEIGHSLGLEHSGNYGQGEMAPHLPGAQDTRDATIMSYYDGTLATANGNPPTTPMIYDIAAIQYLYGANHAYNAGANTYALTGAKQVMTLWDGGGTDTISSTGFTGNAWIDLREGLEYKSIVGNSYVWNAFGASIENGTTGNGNDLLTGNDLPNLLTANGGADFIVGALGQDVIYGGAGNDTIYGDWGQETGMDAADRIYGDAGNDTLWGMDGNDQIYGGGDNDLFFTSLGNDYASGGTGSDTIYASVGDDTILGDEGDDYLFGAMGNDSLTGGAGNDWFVYYSGETGTDVITDFQGAGAAGGDLLAIASNVNGNGLTTTAALAAAVTYGGGNATLDLGAGEIIVLRGITTHLVAADFIIV